MAALLPTALVTSTKPVQEATFIKTPLTKLEEKGEEEEED